MGVYIKGMEMPTNCCQCPVNMEVCKRGYKYLLAHPELYDNRADDCPIIEIQPHGKLGDLDALYAHMCKAHDKWRENPQEYMSINPFTDDETMVLYAPTIIPAEEGGCGRCDHCRIPKTGTCRYGEEGET